jgi:hypothetical protein
MGNRMTQNEGLFDDEAMHRSKFDLATEECGRSSGALG